MSKQPPPVPIASALDHCPTIIQVSRKVYPAVEVETMLFKR